MTSRHRPGDDVEALSDIPAGDFAAWLAEMHGAIRGDHDAEVPCNGCTACCRSSQFVPVAPDEGDTLAHVPRVLLFPAPRLPRGHMVIGYNEQGCCPMLVDDRCSIYEHRPRACRMYDCRVFAAAGVKVEGADKAPVAQQTQRWRFTYRMHADRVKHDSVRAAAVAIREHAEAQSGTAAPRDATELAVLAIKGCDDIAHAKMP